VCVCVHSVAVRDETVKSALLTESAMRTVNKLLSSVAIAESDIDEILSEMSQSVRPCEETDTDLATSLVTGSQ